MARIDPNAFPDRLVFEAHARHLRARELDRIFAATVAELRVRMRAVAARTAGTIGATAARHSGQAH